MPMHLMVYANVQDMEQYRPFIKLTPTVTEAFGDNLLVKAAELVSLEGAETRFVLGDFPDPMTVNTFSDSDKYRAVKELPQGVSSASYIAVKW